MATKEITIQQVMDAIDKNGLPKANGWFSSESGYTHRWDNDNPNTIIGGNGEPPIGSACVLGQACINLEIDPLSLVEGLDKIEGYDWSENWEDRLYTKIYQYNDDNGHSYKQSAYYARRLLKKYADKIITVNTRKFRTVNDEQ